MLFPLALIAAAQGAALASPEDADLRCLTGYLYVVGKMEEDASATAEDKSAVATLATYYLGKLHGRHANLDLTGSVRQLTQSPGYDPVAIKRDIDRCNGEVETWSGQLDALGSAVGGK